MPEGVYLSNELPDWVRLSIADAVVLFGRLEQEIIEISWILKDAKLKERLKLAKEPAVNNFIAVIEAVERASVEHQTPVNLQETKDGFKELAYQRNLMVHGSWRMADGKPVVVWHKFLEDEDTVVGVVYGKWEFDWFMDVGGVLLTSAREFHALLKGTIRW